VYLGEDPAAQFDSGTQNATFEVDEGPKKNVASHGSEF